MPQLRYLATAAALAIVVAQSPVAASAHGGGGHGGHFGGGHAFAGRHFGVGRPVVGGHFDPRLDRQFGRFRGRAIFGVGGIFLGYDFGFGLGFGYPGYYPAWYCSQYPYGYNLPWAATIRILARRINAVSLPNRSTMNTSRAMRYRAVLRGRTF